MVFADTAADFIGSRQGEAMWGTAKILGHDLLRERRDSFFCLCSQLQVATAHVLMNNWPIFRLKVYMKGDIVSLEQIMKAARCYRAGY